ncbi:MAG: thiamine pyrophosphate-binding protein [Chloroflexota bacterium]|nr:thiamine pyrophosphate-binding protein [Chloroflexota bacterium]
MRVYEALADELGRVGVQAVFTLMDAETAKLITEVGRRGIKVFTTRHETAAVGMAHGYARATGGIGIAVVGRGPGFTNSLTALVSAARSRARVVAIVGEGAVGVGKVSAKAAADQPKAIDQAGMLAAGRISHVTLRSPATAVADLGAIVERGALAGPIVVKAPVDVLNAEAGSSDAEVTLPAPPPPRAPDPAAVASVADLLGTGWAAGHPVIVAGRGAVASGALDQLRRLADRIGAVLATTLMARGAFSGDPYDIGVVGTFSSSVGLELTSVADVVLAFGASLAPLTTYGGAIFPKARFVQFDTNPAAFGRFSPADITVQGDAAASASALVAELEHRGYRGPGYRTGDVAARIARYRIGESFTDRSRDGALDPRSVLTQIDRLLPRDRTIVVDAGHHLTFSGAYLAVTDPAAFMITVDSPAIGSAPGVAMGAAVARPDRLTVLCVGDGGFMITLSDLDTAVRYGLRLLVIVMNDSAFGAELHMLRLFGLPDDLSRYRNPSFEKIAIALGADGATLSSLDDIDRLDGRLARLDRPMVLDCQLTTDVRGDWVEFMHR